MNNQNIKVKFEGKEYWRVGDALAPLEHCDENGELIEFFGESFAHIFSGDIMRFGRKIGEEKDLEIITSNR